MSSHLPTNLEKNKIKNQSHLVTFTQLTLLQYMLLWKYKPGWMLRTKHKSSSWDARRILPRIGCLSKKGLIQLLKILHRNLDLARSGNKKNHLTRGSLICRVTCCWPCPIKRNSASTAQCISADSEFSALCNTSSVPLHTQTDEPLPSIFTTLSSLLPGFFTPLVNGRIKW